MDCQRLWRLQSETYEVETNAKRWLFHVNHIYYAFKETKGFFLIIHQLQLSLFLNYIITTVIRAYFLMGIVTEIRE